MRWLVGWSSIAASFGTVGAVGNGGEGRTVHPVGSQLLWGDPDPLWAVGDWRPDEIRVKDGEIVGTYRLLRQSVAERTGGFYTQGEFDIAPLIARHSGFKFLELGRSCVLKPYRTKPVVELLWQGIWNYVRLYDLDVMLGCASLEGTDPSAHAMGLSFMAQNSAAMRPTSAR